MNLEFDKFVKSFDMNDDNIKRKYNHSYRVKKLCETLTKDKKKKKISSVIGLLHDYGRFYQWTKYKTFKDKKSIDHADYAVKELFDNNQIEKFYHGKKYYKVISEAIKYHNKYLVPDDVEDKIMCEMIRDADKLDILYMYTIGELVLSEEGNISKKVKNEFFKHNMLKHEYVNTEIDVSINVLSLVYDLNINESFKYLKDNKIMDKIYEKIKNKEIFKDYIKEVKKFIDEKQREEDEAC